MGYQDDRAQVVLSLPSVPDLATMFTRPQDSADDATESNYLVYGPGGTQLVPPVMV